MSKQWLLSLMVISFLQIILTNSLESASTGHVIDSSSYYRLTNDYSGPDLALGVKNDGREYAVHMVPISEETGQSWRLISLGNSVYKLQNRFLKNTYSLDIVNDKSNRHDKMPHMAKTGLYTGQRWHLLPQSSGTFRLFNDFTGNKLFLDVTEKSPRAQMNIDNDGEVDAGQHWTFTKI